VSAPTADWEAQVQAMEAVYDVGMDASAPAVLAIRGDRLALVKVSFISGDEREIPLLAFLRNNAAGLADRYTYCGIDQLAEAAEELDRLYLEGEGAEFASVLEPILGFVAAANRNDRVTLHDFFSGPDLVLIDHTPGSFGLQTAQEALDRVDSMLDLVPGLRRVEAEFHRVNHRGAVITSDHYRPDDELGSPSWRYHAVALIEDGRATAAEIFPEDQLAEALSRFDELAVEDNRCSLAMKENAASLRASDFDRLRRVFAPGVRRIDRRSGMTAAELSTREEFVDSLAAVLDVGLTMGLLETVETRGERYALVRFEFVGAGGETLGALSVSRADLEGLLDLVIHYDLDDLEAARTELDRLYAEDEGVVVQPIRWTEPAEDVPPNRATEFGGVLVAGDWGAVAAMIRRSSRAAARSDRPVATSRSCSME
jgi:hypothetical protein